MISFAGILQRFWSEVQNNYFIEHVLITATSKTWTRTLDLEKSGPWKTWILKNMDPEKRGINMGLKNMSDFRELRFKKNKSWKVYRYLT